MPSPPTTDTPTTDTLTYQRTDLPKMLYPITERQERFLTVAKKLAAGFAETAAEYDRTAEFPIHNFDAAREAGLPALIIPEEFGGWGADLLDTVMVLEALAQGDGSTAIGIAMHFQTMGSANENRGWSAELFERLCRESVTKGAMINSIATEPELGSPSRGGIPKTTAHAADGSNSSEPDAWLLNGIKTWATMFPALTYMITPAALQDGSGNVARFIVDTACPDGGSIEIVKHFDSMGMRASASHDIELKNVQVSHANIINISNSASPVKGGKMNAWFMLGMSAVYLGVANCAHQAAIRYARNRVPTALGRPIATLDTIQRRLGDAELLLRQARVLLYQAADMWVRFPDRRLEMTPTIATAKYTATNNAIAAVDQSMRAVGGNSMMKDLPLERCYRDVRAGLSQPLNDDVALVTLGKLAIQTQENAQT